MSVQLNCASDLTPRLTHPSPLAKRVESVQRLYPDNIGRARAHILQDVCVRASFMGLEKLELLEVYLATT